MHLKIRGQNNPKTNPCPSQYLPLDIALSIIPSLSSFFDLLSGGFSLGLSSYLPKGKKKTTPNFDPVSPPNISIEFLTQTFRKKHLYSLPPFSFPLIYDSTHLLSACSPTIPLQLFLQFLWSLNCQIK